MKSFTEEEVEKMLKITLAETVESFLEWLKAETVIVDKNTNEVLLDAEIELKPDADAKSFVHEYIYPRLRKRGIML